MALGIISLIIFFIIDSMKRNLKVMLQQHYAPYSEKRMNMTINVLKDYGIEIQNFDSLDMLIEEAKQAQIQCNYIAPLKKPFKTLGAIIIPIVAFVAQKIGNAASSRRNDYHRITNYSSCVINFFTNFLINTNY